MGPRSADRGNFFKQPEKSEAGQLQWGLDQLIEEMLKSLKGEGKDVLLQWGLDQLIEEIGAPFVGSKPINAASMGPRSADRGNQRHSLHRICADQLQWGLDQLIEEMELVASAEDDAASFNGASIS